MVTVIKQRCGCCGELKERTDSNFYFRRSPGTIAQRTWLPYCRVCYAEHPELREETERTSPPNLLDPPFTVQKPYQE